MISEPHGSTKVLMNDNRSTLTEILRHRALHQPEQLAFTFLAHGEAEAGRLTYAELDRRARAVGALLQSRAARGERVLLLFDAGLEFIEAFFGCLYGGLIAVPAPPPHPSRLQRTLPRVQAIVADAQPVIALTTRAMLSLIEKSFAGAPDLHAISWIALDDVTQELAGEWRDERIVSDELAYLQYTSGSTSTPKGVMINHLNLIHQSVYLRHAYAYTTESVSATWMPNFHDYGLVEGLIHPVCMGIPAYVMSPLAFVQQPARWLRAITRYRVTHSAAPNFAYELCVRKVTTEQRAALDLSCWQAAGNAAEPVHKETMERFYQTFAACGFRWNAFYPSYGLAEATLMVSAGGDKKGSPLFLTIEVAPLEQENRVVEAAEGEQGARSLAGCGQPILETEVVIVHPEELRRCAPDEVGEIWIKDVGVAQGYWNRPAETAQRFKAYLAGTGEGPFFRTGDLGFIKHGEVFISGRHKDLIIIRGQNHYPQDIEWTIEKSHPLLRPGCSAAFSVEMHSEERLVVVQEVRNDYRPTDEAEVIAAIRTAVTEQHELQVAAIVLIKQGSINKTSSGKIQRHACRQEFLDASLEALARWHAPALPREPDVPDDYENDAAPDDGAHKATRNVALTKQAIADWLVGQLSVLLKINQDEVDVRRSFAHFGLDSAQVVSMVGDLSGWSGRALLAPTLFWDYPSIEQVAQHLAEDQTFNLAEDQTFISAPGFTQTPRRVPDARQLSVDEPIAIIGMSCRLPGAVDVEAFWQLLRNGVDAITEVPPDRWDAHALYESQRAVPGKTNTRWGGFLRDVDLFDANFFGISPREAAQIDPQQRLLMEVAWEALEHAGYAAGQLGNTQTGVFVGISNSDYARFQFDAHERLDAYVGTGTALSIAANRLSYWLDLRGPSMAVDTACSSSLVAVHMACQSLRVRESEMTLAGGVNLLLLPDMTIALSQAHMMAADGRCKTFDAGADGYVRSEGCGVVVLKRLSDALRDNDHVLALVRGSAVNQDGRSNGLTAPNGPAQQKLLRQALENARVEPRQISYVEAHGTGTSLGDPIEVESLVRVLGEGREQRCALGSVKTNIGHLEAAAGIAGLIKVVLSLQQEQIPPHLHLKKLNPYISLDARLFEIPERMRPWARGSEPRYAGVSSFGFGGTNAHVVLEEAPAVVAPASDDSAIERPLHLLSLSAQSDAALKELANRYAVHLAGCSRQELLNVCYTANTGRTHFAHRVAVVGDTPERLAQLLHAFTLGEKRSELLHARVSSRQPPKLAFMFTGQGAQYARMGRELYETQPLFRRLMNECDEILRPHLSQTLLDVLYNASEESTRLQETAFAQPALFALGYALARLWQSWGIEPDAVLGHSVGEYVAACVAGAFTFEEGLKLTAERGRLMQALPERGEMAVVFADEATVNAALSAFDGRVSIAAANGATNTVISGASETVRNVLARLEREGITTQRLNVSHAFHSPLVEPMLEPFAQALQQANFRALRLPLISNLSGQVLNAGHVMDAAYWIEQARKPVRFMAGLQTLAAQGIRVFVEIGPTAALLNMGRRCLPEEAYLWLPSMKPGQSDWQVMLGSAGKLYVHGKEIDWKQFDHDYRRSRVPLPTYPFERKRHWLSPPVKSNRDQAALNPLAASSGRELPASAPIHQASPKGNNGLMQQEQAGPPAVEPEQRQTSKLISTRNESSLSMLRDITARLLQTEPDAIDVDASFLEMGADSIVLVEAIRIIEDTLAIKLSIRQLFEEFPTLAALAAHVDKSSAVKKVNDAARRENAILPAPPTHHAPAQLAQTPLPHIASTPLTAAPSTAFAAQADAPTTHEQSHAAPANTLERVMSQQLELLSQVMSKQLEILNRSQSPAGVAPTHEAALVKTQQHPPAQQKNENDGLRAGAVTRESSMSEAVPATSAGSNQTAAAAFVPHRAIKPGTTGGFSERQQKHLSALVEGFTRRTSRSKQLAQTYRPVLADSRAVVGFRLSIKEMLYPIVGADARGSRLTDVDGNEYIDLTMGFGVHLFGHRPPFVAAAIDEQLRQGIELGPRPSQVGEVARLICEFTKMERATFCNSGTEAVMTALRLARAKTGRTKVAMFAGSYHGHSDGTLARAHFSDGEPRSMPLAPGIPPHVVEDILVLDYDSPQSLDVLHRRGHELAAVLVEPVQSRRPDLQPAEFLRQLRQLTAATETVLIFDEMVTGFRVHPGGAQGWFGVEADIATYGKILGGGMPIGVVAGKAEFMAGIDGGMWNYGDESYPQAETTYFGGTFCQHPLAMASALAVLKHLRQSGATLQQELNQRTAEFAAHLNTYFKQHDVPIQIAHFGSLFRFAFTGNMDLLFYHLLTKGVYVWEWRNCFLSTAHTDADIARVIQAVKESVEEMREGGFIPPSTTSARLDSDPAANGSGSLPRTPAFAGAVAQGDNLRQESAALRSGDAPANGTGKGRGSSLDAHQPLGFWGRSESKPSLLYRRPASHTLHSTEAAKKSIEFSLYYFGNYEAEFDEHKYDLLIEGAKFADRHHFKAIWIPERHFHSFGGISPNPSVIAAALARETSRIHLRAGSVVLPLHHPVRVAEEWSVVDNLSKGRVGISFASGWHPDDFVFAPEAYGNHRELMFEKIEEIRELWRGGTIEARGGAGNDIRVKLFPLPMQRELPVWITVVNNPETYRRAGRIGASLLTNLMGQTLEDLEQNIAIYRRALAEHGHDPEAGHVSLLLHTFVGENADSIRRKAFQPFCDYLRSSLGLLQNLLKSQRLQIDFARLTEDDINYLLAAAYERYVQTSALIGTPDTCSAVVANLSAVGVDEIACFIDFGVDAASVLENLPSLNALHERHSQRQEETPERVSANVSTALPALPTTSRGSNGQGGESISHDTPLSTFNSIDTQSVSVGSEPAPSLAEDEQLSINLSPPTREAHIAPLTEEQKQLWILAQMGDDASCAYNEIITLQLLGSLSLPGLRRAFQLVVDRHEALRTTIDAGGNFQRILPALSLDVPLLDFTDAGSIEEREARARRWLEAEGRRPFDLTTGPLVRVCVLKLEERRHLLLLNVHHIIADGWSIGVLLKEVSAIYGAERSEGVGPELEPPVQFAEYVRYWQQQPEYLSRLAEAESYWLKQLTGSLPVSEFPADHPRPPVQTYNGARQHTKIESSLCADLKRLSRQNNSTLFMTLLAAYTALLHRYTGQREVVVGVPIAGRSFEGSEKLVGYCTRPVPVRVHVAGDPTFAEHLAAVKNLLLAAYEHQDYSLSRLLEQLDLPRNLSRFPLFSNTFNMERLTLPQMFELEVTLISFPVSYAKFETSLSLFEHQGELLIDFDYNTNLFDEATITRLLGCFQTLLQNIAADPDRRLSALSLLSPAERHQLLFEWNETTTDYAPQSSIHELFEVQARHSAARVAVVSEGRQVTYAELNRRANQLAHYLRRLGVETGTPIGLCMERSIEMVVAMLGILKAGGAYVPLDPAYPIERLAYMLDDARSPMLLTQENIADKFATHTGYVICLDTEWLAIAKESDEDDGAADVGADHLAYIIYTSGSTGAPKGVAVSHGAVNSLLVNANYVQLTDADVVAQVSTSSFDAATFEIWGALLHGARLVIIGKETALSSTDFAAQLKEHEISVLFLTTALFNHLAREVPTAFQGVRHLLFGGEAVEPRWVREILAHGPPQRLLHVYGPTEATTFTSWYPVEDVPEGATTVPIGRPVANRKIFIVDEHMQPVPVGVAGELCIGGDGLARGYVGQPMLTAERFLPDSFSDQPGARLYRTGDTARYLADGNIEFLGRFDHQVKIRGFRVETGEIEFTLARHPAVSTAVVVARVDTAGDKSLVAYIVPHGEHPATSELRRYLATHLPEYMMPDAFVQLAELPLTPGGKIDRHALPPPDGSRPELEMTYVAPRTAIERQLAHVWAEVLGLKQVGVHDNFFDLGGHSLRATQVISRVRNLFRVELSMRTLFEFPTVEGFAQWVEHTKEMNQADE